MIPHPSDDCHICLRSEISALRGEIARLNEELRRAGAAQSDVADKSGSFQKFQQYVHDQLAAYTVCYCQRLVPADILKVYGCTHWYYDRATHTNQPNRRKAHRRTRPTMTGLHYDGQRTWGDNYSFGNPERRVADRRKR